MYYHIVLGVLVPPPGWEDWGQWDETRLKWLYGQSTSMFIRSTVYWKRVGFSV